MSGSLQEIKEEIRRAVDIVDLVGSAIDLRRQGRGYVGRCPWHDDSRPSLQVNPDRQSWKCWVCNIGGDIFSFIMQREGVEFGEALKLLAERAGVELTRTPGRPAASDDKVGLYAAVAWAEQQFHHFLLEGSEAEPARRYLHQRGITVDSVRRFRIGFAPPQWQWLHDRAGGSFTPQQLAAVGLIGKSANSGRFYDLFRGRVMFPIRDTQRRPIAFGGRILPELATDRDAKYYNSPETRLFSKSEHLYGLDLARDAVTRTRQIAVVEGYTDVVMAHQAGLEQVVAVLGTALTERHVRVLRRFADRITLLLDGDSAGRKRAAEVLDLFLTAQVDLRVLTLPEELDPCDFLLQRGGESLRTLLESAVDAVEHRIRTAIAGIDLARDAHAASAALEEILQSLARAPRLSLLTQEQQRLREQQVLRRLARQFGVEETMVRERIAQMRSLARPGRSAAGEDFAPGGEQLPTVSIEDLDSLSRELLEILCGHPELADLARERLDPQQVAHPAAREIYLAICRLTDSPEGVEYTRVMAELDRPELKNLWCDLDHWANAKAEHAADSPQDRLADLLTRWNWDHHDADLRGRLIALEEHQVDEQEEVDILRSILANQRRRQGLSAPTDG